MNVNAQKIESLLFYFNEEMGKKRLATLASVSLAELEEVIVDIKEARKDSGIVVVDTQTTISLGTHPNTANLIESVTEAETVSPLSKAALETLSVILYQSPVTRAEIDVVRGVNSLYSVRNLLVRGLISRRTIDGSIVYEPTTETLQLLGVSSSQDMPDYADVLTKLDAITKGQSEVESKDTDKSQEEPTTTREEGVETEENTAEEK